MLRTCSFNERIGNTGRSFTCISARAGERQTFLPLDGGHLPPLTADLKREMLNWLDRCLGPVRRNVRRGLGCAHAKNSYVGDLGFPLGKRPHSALSRIEDDFLQSNLFRLIAMSLMLCYSIRLDATYPIHP
jgi:hypothetical protein